MTDLQRAIEWLEEMKGLAEQTIEESKKLPYAVNNIRHYKRIENCRALLDALRWVPISEPPKKTGIYLVSLSSQWSPEKGYVYMAKYLGSGEWAVESVPDGTVTHWRPLPAPPEEERTTWI